MRDRNRKERYKGKRTQTQNSPNSRDPAQPGRPSSPPARPASAARASFRLTQLRMAQAVPHFFPSRMARRGPAFFPPRTGLLSQRGTPHARSPDPPTRGGVPKRTPLSRPARTPVASSHRRLDPTRQRLPFPLSFLPAVQQRTQYPRRARRDPYPAAPRHPRRSPFNWPPTDPPCSLFYALAPPTNPSRCPPSSERSRAPRRRALTALLFHGHREPPPEPCLSSWSTPDHLLSQLHRASPGISTRTRRR